MVTIITCTVFTLLSDAKFCYYYFASCDQRNTFLIYVSILVSIWKCACAAMAVGRKFSGARKMLIFLYVHILCCSIFHKNFKKMSNVLNWQQLYVCSEVVKAKISVFRFKRQRHVKQRPLANSIKLIVGCRLLLYIQYSIILIKLSGDIEINHGPTCSGVGRSIIGGGGGAIFIYSCS